MRANRLQTLWLMLKSSLIMFRSCSLAVIKQFFKRINRQWVDKELNWWAQALLKTAKVHVKIDNPHKVQFNPNQRYIVMCNHTSLYDIPLCITAIPGSVRMLAKQELARIPIMGAGMKAADFPFIDRQNRLAALKDLQHLQQLMDKGIIVWLAPEGTRSKTGQLAKLKIGGFIAAIEAKAMIVPIGIRGANKILPTQTWQFHLNQTVEIHFGQPIDASQYALTEKKQLLAEVEQQLQELTGCGSSRSVS